MIFQAYIKKHVLRFKFPAGTSRGILHDKISYFIILKKDENIGIGECSIIQGLSLDDVPDYEEILKWAVSQIQSEEDFNKIDLLLFPSIKFGLETAILDLENGGNRTIFQGDFIKGLKHIPINGLIWMGDKNFMNRQIAEKMEAGYKCLKLKIGAIDFESELQILEAVRKEYGKENLEIRLDANGAFHKDDALEKLEKLAPLHIHSVEQPIKAGQYEEMAQLCFYSPIPIALDEELIGNFDVGDKMALVQRINPKYIIIKPSMVGGIGSAMEWISAAERSNVKWWATSALESNIGLNAIAQWIDSMNTNMVHGLGTGMLYHNNIPSPLTIKENFLYYDNSKKWDLNEIL